MGPDLKDNRWIILKGGLFLFLAVMSGLLELLAEVPLWQRAILLLICIWSSCRFYYFLFHVLHAYVDPELKSAGIGDLLGKLLRRKP